MMKSEAIKDKGRDAKELQRRLGRIKTFNIVVSAMGLEGVVGGVHADEFSLLYLRRDLIREFKGEIDRGWLMTRNVYAKFSWSDTVKVLESDQSLIVS